MEASIYSILTSASRRESTWIVCCGTITTMDEPVQPIGVQDEPLPPRCQFPLKHWRANEASFPAAQPQNGRF
jgi:hypothetical protein